jgi:hypothetical protein
MNTARPARTNPPPLRLIKGGASAQRTSCAPGLCEGLPTCGDRQCHGHPLHSAAAHGACGEVCSTHGCTQSAGCLARLPSPAFERTRQAYRATFWRRAALAYAVVVVVCAVAAWQWLSR